MAKRSAKPILANWLDCANRLRLQRPAYAKAAKRIAPAPKQMVTHSSNFQSRVAQKINAKQLMKPKTAIERAVNGTLPNSRRTKRNGDI